MAEAGLFEKAGDITPSSPQNETHPAMVPDTMCLAIKTLS